MPDETKLALTDCASHRLVRPVTFRAVRHCFLLLACVHFGCTKTNSKGIVTNGSIERRLSSGIQRGWDDDTKAQTSPRVRPLRSRDCFRPAEASITSHARLASQSGSHLRDPGVVHEHDNVLRRDFGRGCGGIVSLICMSCLLAFDRST